MRYCQKLGCKKPIVCRVHLVTRANPEKDYCLEHWRSHIYIEHNIHMSSWKDDYWCCNVWVPRELKRIQEYLSFHPEEALEL
jgi:hypothetical protein